MATRTVIVTGGNGSLGSKAAEALMANPSTNVVMTGRRPEETQQHADRLNELYGREAAIVLPLDLASLDSIRAFVDEFARLGVACDALVASAGVQVVGDSWSEDGFETTFAVNYLGNFVLANLLLPHYSPAARIVLVGSGAHDPLDRLARASGMPAPQLQTVAEMARPDPSDDPKHASETGRRRYTTSKLCTMLFVRELAARLREQDSAVTVNGFGPGLMPGTGLARDGSKRERFVWNYLLPALIPFVPNVHGSTASARNLARLVTDPELQEASGAYFVGTKRKAPSVEARDGEKGRILWSETMELLDEHAPLVAAAIRSETPDAAPEVFDAVSVIAAKRDRKPLSDGQIDWMISNFASGQVADEQMAALAMAVFLNGLDRRELVRWTQAMIDSGERLNLSGLERGGSPLPTADKHSTGGVGDKTTLPLVPLVAACGVAVPQLSGRGLGHTGGTLDKLESIPGWSPELSPEAFIAQLKRIGGVVAAASGDLAPADRRLYALRDVTGAVESIPLIASSIMSKKIAEGTSALVLDVKVGSGAFMRDVARARELARTMVAIGTDAGVRTTALLTGMDAPLGFAVGNAIEVAESVDVLRGGGPDDVRELTLALAEEMLRLAGVAADPRDALDSGRAYESWCAMVRAQGGDPEAPLPEAAHREVLVAPKSGRLVRADARGVGVAAWRLGAGRERQGDPVSFGAGVLLAKRPGDMVEEGEPLATMLADDPERFDRARDLLATSFAIADSSASFVPRALILDRVG